MKLARRSQAIITAMATSPDEGTRPAASASASEVAPAADIEEVDAGGQPGAEDRRDRQQQREARRLGPLHAEQRAAVMVMPDRLVPGISASAWARPISSTLTQVQVLDAPHRHADAVGQNSRTPKPMRGPGDDLQSLRDAVTRGRSSNPAAISGIVATTR